MSKATPRDPIDVFKSCATFSELPNESGPLSERKIVLHRTNPSEEPLSKRDLEFRKYEEYLRLKWGGDEAMPADFDPHKLEAAFKARYKSRMENKDAVRAATEFLVENELSKPNTNVQYQEQEYLYSEQANASSESLFTDVSAAERSYMDEQFDDYENETIVEIASPASKPRVTRTPDSGTDIVSMSASIERIPTPRIRAGSRPPLSRSAFSGSGLPSPRDGFPGRRPGETLREYPRAPKYFPFKSKVAKDNVPTR
ncbi:hypothetical protein F5Y05DRAFT_386239 [Hypoxylon sp. FL0543]|nr:hypothetical protein F5Y05DRAFT_386239 [Hypoxylon sp. FL0543]